MSVWWQIVRKTASLADTIMSDTKSLTEKSEFYLRT